MSIQDWRDFLEGFATGSEGLARYELELRLHANTWARWGNCLEREKGHKASIVQKDIIIDARTKERDAFATSSLMWERKAKRRGTGEKLLAVAAVLALGYAATK